VEYAMEVVKQGFACIGLRFATHAVHTAIASQQQQADHAEFPSVPYLISFLRTPEHPCDHATHRTPDQCFIPQSDIQVSLEVAAGAQPKKTTLRKFSYRGVVVDALLDMSMDYPFQMS
jgi:hypothetical protein